MKNPNAPIGVIDTGVGGLTVASQLQKLYPREEILYFGDSANCPYGTRTADEIVTLTRLMLDFLEQHQVKALAIACNTISTLVDQLTGYSYPIVGIVAPAAQAVAKLPITKVGLTATAFTVKSEEYPRLIHRDNPNIAVIGRSGERMAALVDANASNDDVDQEIRNCIDNMMETERPSHVILGCTHYPVVIDRYRACYPDTTFIDPALEQVKALISLLEADNLLCTEERVGRFTYCTSGSPEAAHTVIDKLGMRQPDVVCCLQLV